MDILPGLQGYFPVFIVSILTCPQGLNLFRWRGEAEAGSVTQIKYWRNSALCFPSNTSNPKGSNQEQCYAHSPFRAPLPGESKTVGRRKHRTSPKNISSGRLGEFVLANEYPALHQSNKSVNEHHTHSYPQYMSCFAIRGAKVNVQWMYKGM